MRNKVTSAAEAVAIVQSGDAVCTSGFVGIGVPDALLVALERRFLDTGEPRDLTLLFAAGEGDGKEQSLAATAPASGLDNIAWAQPDSGGALQYDSPSFQNGATLAGPISATFFASSTTSNLEL